MAPIVQFDRFDVQMAQDCLQYLADSFEWLTADGDNFSSVSDQLNWPQLQQMSKIATTLLSNVCKIHNRFPTINKLPPEVLAVVFKYLIPRHKPQNVLDLPQRVSWPLVSRVCGYWRRIAIYTPGLWTFIQAPVHGSQGATSCRDFALLSLERSGSLPLSVQYNEGDAIGPDTIPFEDILRYLPRIQDLSLAGKAIDNLRLLTSPAPMLQTFVVYSSDISDDTTENIPAPFDGWQTPRLETLLISGCSAWNKLSIRHLRRLVISDQTFYPSSMASLYHILSLNTRLEDLLLHDISCDFDNIEEMREALVQMPPLEFSSLQRICILDSDGSDYPVMTTALSPKIITISDSWYRYFNFSYVIDTGLALPAGVVPQQAIISPQRLAYLDSMIIASDGHRCLQLDVHLRPGINPMDVVRVTIQPSDVRELWLSTTNRTVAPSLEGMRKVTTLVFPEFGASAIAVWLGKITERQLFPKLEEVRVWTRTNQDGSGRPLLDFLKRRQEIGQGIHTLRFLKHPDTPVNTHCTFDRWKARPKKFRRVADHVVFEEPKERRWMELPDICELPWPLEENVYPPIWPQGVFS